jgi:hypothetical protein
MNSPRMKFARHTIVLILSCTLFGSTSAFGQDRATKVRNDRVRIQDERFWIYNDLPTGIALARQTGKPLLVVFRCIPCEHCAQLDERVVEQDPVVQSLLNKFVCVRNVYANGMDLSLFQFDYDQSWAAFFLNADLTIYGRYGTRSHQTESDSDVSLEGFAKALQGALELHQQFPLVRERLAAKRGPAPQTKVPEEFPNLKGKYSSKIDYEGQVVQSCIHCHQLGESLRLEARSKQQPIPDPILFPYPHPKSLGLIMDPKEKARVAKVQAGSWGEQSGFRAGDDISSLSGQPILSIADVQWVLHHAGDSAVIAAEVQRAGKPMSLTLNLPAGWRRQGDISWRATSWELRRMVGGGLVFEELPAADRNQAGIAESQLALRVKHVGQYGDHAVGKKAGFLVGDVVVAVDNRSEPLTESELLARLINAKRPGDRLPMTVLRGGKKLELTLTMQ